jgi:hypothetical protein
MSAHKEYPDILEIVALKLSGRRQRAALSFAEKLDLLDALREHVRPLVEARKARRAEQEREESAAAIKPPK